MTALRRALTLRRDTNNQSVLANIEFLLAKAVWGEATDPQEAMALAGSAAARYRTIAPDHTESGTAVRAWLDAHEPRLPGDG